MPVFRVVIVYNNRKRRKTFHVVEGIDLDTYYTHVYKSIQIRKAVITGFEVVQLSEHSPEAKFLRSKMKEMT